MGYFASLTARWVKFLFRGGRIYIGFSHLCRAMARAKYMHG